MCVMVVIIDVVLKFLFHRVIFIFSSYLYFLYLNLNFIYYKLRSFKIQTPILINPRFIIQNINSCLC